jgi:hypothetical protein
MGLFFGGYELSLGCTTLRVFFIDIGFSKVKHHRVNTIYKQALCLDRYLMIMTPKFYLVLRFNI